MKESEIQKQCLTYLSATGFFAWKNHMQGMRVAGRMVKNPAAGSADIFAIKAGKFFCIEVKTPEGKLSPHQHQWLNKAHEHGAISMVVRSLDDLIDCLSKARDSNFIFDVRI